MVTSRIITIRTKEEVSMTMSIKLRIQSNATTTCGTAGRMVLMLIITAETALNQSRGTNGMQHAQIHWEDAKQRSIKQYFQETMVQPVGIQCITCDGEGQSVVIITKLIIC
jgi:hypothetical protein